MDKLQLRSANADDLRLLAEMNKQLIEDEGSANPMNLEELQQRMKGWLQASWSVDLIMDGAETVGYVLYCFKENQYNDKMREAYIRQYFIKREHRKKGFGLKGIELLKETRFAGVENIEIDVLDSNGIGKNFWTQAGFKPYAINMRWMR